MGTPDFAVESLKILVENTYNVVGVITMPDKPSGRGHKLQFSAVKQYAIEKNPNILQPEKLKDESFLEALKALPKTTSAALKQFASTFTITYHHEENKHYYRHLTFFYNIIHPLRPARGVQPRHYKRRPRSYNQVWRTAAINRTTI